MILNFKFFTLRLVLNYFAVKKMKKQILIAYLLQNILRIIIDCLYLYLFHQMFSLTVPFNYKCQGYPCPNLVDCYISRPKEKQFVTRFLYFATVFSVVLTFLDLWWVLVRKLSHTIKKKDVGFEMKSVASLKKNMELEANMQILDNVFCNPIPSTLSQKVNNCNQNNNNRQNFRDPQISNSANG